jgi:hypothetical protein
MSPRHHVAPCDTIAQENHGPGGGEVFLISVNWNVLPETSGCSLLHDAGVAKAPACPKEHSHG